MRVFIGFIIGLCLVVRCCAVAAAPAYQYLSWTGPTENILALNTPYPISANASSGLPVTLRMVAGPAVIDNGRITVSGLGSVHVAAEQAGNGEFVPARVTRSFNVRQVVLETIGLDATPGGSARGLRVVGNRAYLLDGRNLVVIDVSNPATPRRLGTYRAKGTPTDIRVVGQYAYLANNVSIPGDVPGLEIVDVSDPENLTRVGSNDAGQQAFAVDVAGNYAYVVDTASGLRILDVTNPATPVLAGQFRPGELAIAIQVVGGIAYIAANDAGLQIVDVSNPSKPTRLGSLESLKQARGVQVVGDRAYLIQSSGGLNVVDVSNPREPKLLGYEQYDQGFDVEVRGDYAFVAGYFNGLLVVDVSDPTQPKRLWGFAAGVTFDVQVVGDLIYTAFAETFPTPDSALSGLKILRARFGFPNWLNFYPPTEMALTNEFIALTERSSNGAMVNYSVVSGPARVAGTNLVFTGVGEVRLRAEQVDDGLYLPIRAEWQIQVVKAPQTFTWSGIPESILALNEPYPIGATANSGLPVVLRVESGPARIVGGTIIATNLGPVRVTAEVSGDEKFSPAREVRSFNVPPMNLSPISGYVAGGSGMYALRVKDKYAYVVHVSGGLHIIDISDPTKPSRVGGFDTSGEALDVDVAGNYAYVADGPQGLQVIEISNATNATLVGHIDTPGFARGVFAAGQQVFVADSQEGLRVIDVTDPAIPKFAGRFDTRGVAYAVQVAGTIAYVADGHSGLQIIDVGDPAAPKLLSEFKTKGEAFAVEVVGNLAYVTDSQVCLDVIDVTDPARLLPAGKYAFNYPPLGVHINGKYAWLAGGQGGVKVLDISLPANPMEVGGFQTPAQAAQRSSGAFDVQVAGNFLYVADYGEGLRIFSWDDSRHPQRISWLEPLAEALPVGAEYALNAKSTSGLPVSFRVEAGPSIVENGKVRVTGPGTIWISAEQEGDRTYLPVVETRAFNLLPARISPIGRYALEVPGSARSLDLVDDLIYVAAEEAGLIILNVSDPLHPRFVGSHRKERALEVRVAGNHAFVWDDGLLILDVSDPTQPKEVGSLATFGGVYAMELAGNYVVLADGGGLQLIDASDRTKPVLVGSYYGVEAYDLAVAGNRAYFAGLGGLHGGLHVVDFSDPARPTQIGALETAGVLSEIHLSEPHIFAYHHGTVMVIDVSDPAQPKKAGELGLEAITAITGQGGYLYLLNEFYVDAGVRRGALHVLDASNPARPVRVGSFNSEGEKRDVRVKGPFAYVASGRGGVEVFHVEFSDRPELRLIPHWFQREVSWNSALQGVKLQRSQSLGPGASWQDAPELPYEYNGESRLPIVATEGNAFFRLIKR